MHKEELLYQARVDLEPMSPEDLAWLSLFTLPLESSEREIVSGMNQGVVTPSQTDGFFKTIFERGKNKLEEIGYDYPTFVQFLIALKDNDLETLSQHFDESRVKFKKERDNRKIGITREMLELALETVFDVPRSENQKIRMVVGPFAAGKSEVSELINGDQYVAIDLDIIRAKLSSKYEANNQNDVERVRRESWVVSDLITKIALINGRSVLMETALHRDRWLNDPNILYAQDNGIPIYLHVVARPLFDCAARNLNRIRSVTADDLMSSILGLRMLKEFVTKFKDIIQNVQWLDMFSVFESRSQIFDKFSWSIYEEFLVFAEENSIENGGVFEKIDRSRDIAIKAVDTPRENIVHD